MRVYRPTALLERASFAWRSGARNARAPSKSCGHPPEREQHGAIEFIDQPIADEHGAVSRPLRAIILARRA